MGIGHIKNAGGNVELAAPHFDRAAAKIDRGGAAGDPHSQIGISDGRQAGDGTQGRAAGLDIDGKPVFWRRRPAALERQQRCITGNYYAFDDAATALADQQNRRVVGKAVLVVSPEGSV